MSGYKGVKGSHPFVTSNTHPTLCIVKQTVRRQTINEPVPQYIPINGCGHIIEVMCNTFQCKPVVYWVVYHVTCL